MVRKKTRNGEIVTYRLMDSLKLKFLASSSPVDVSLLFWFQLSTVPQDA